MNENRRVFLANSIEELKKNLAIAAQFTKALSDSIDGGIDAGCTLEVLQTVELISEAIRCTISSPEIFDAICRLTDSGILDAAEMKELGICEKIVEGK